MWYIKYGNPTRKKPLNVVKWNTRMSLISFPSGFAKHIATSETISKEKALQVSKVT